MSAITEQTLGLAMLVYHNAAQKSIYPYPDVDGLRAALESALTTSADPLKETNEFVPGEVASIPFQGQHAPIGGISPSVASVLQTQPDPVMDAAWKVWGPRAAMQFPEGMELFNAAVRAGVEVATTAVEQSAGHVCDAWRDQVLDLQKTVERLRAAIKKQDATLLVLDENIRRSNRENEDLRAQLAAMDWQPISTPPKAEEKPNYTGRQTPVGDIIKEVWEECAPKKRIPWTMADAVEHKDAWIRSLESPTIVPISGVRLDGIYVVTKTISWKDLMEGEYSHTPQDPASWRGCWKEEE